MASKLAPEAPEGCVLHRFFAQMPNLPTKRAGGHAGGASPGGAGGGGAPSRSPVLRSGMSTEPNRSTEP
eukprot:15471683-Alexandrium_andersonii.AAC.1